MILFVCIVLGYQAAFGLNCGSIPDVDRCQDHLKPCMRLDNPVKEACVIENGPGCSGGLIYCPSNAAKTTNGYRCGTKGCHIGSCMHDDSTDACHPAFPDGSCPAFTSKCQEPLIPSILPSLPTPSPTAPSPEPTLAPSPEPTMAPSPEPTMAPTAAPTMSPITSITQKCAVGVSYYSDGVDTLEPSIYSYDLITGDRYGWSQPGLGQTNGRLRSTALDRSSNILYTALQISGMPNRLLGYNMDTKTLTLNKQLNLLLGGLDYNENDGYLYGGSDRNNHTKYGRLYKISTDGTIITSWQDILPGKVKGLLISKDYSTFYIINRNSTLWTLPVNDPEPNDLTEISLNVIQNNGIPDTINWYTDDINDNILLICYSWNTPECWTYDLDTQFAEQLFVVNSYQSIGGIEVLYDEYESCDTLVPTCPISFTVTQATKWWVGIQLVGTECGCGDNIDYVELIASNKQIKLYEPEWYAVFGRPGYGFPHKIGNDETPFEPPFSVKVSQNGKEFYAENAFGIDETIPYSFDDNFCDA